MAVMAIYHFSAKIISRAAGSSALAAAAYRSASRLHDERLDRHHDFSNKAGVVHSEVMLPDGAPEEWSDRERLWNDVEAAEVRKDAQLAREVEFAIPREMTQAQGVELARDFVQREFVDRGMVADLNVHWDIGADGEPKPHAHVMLGMREVSDDGFGAKVRDWNATRLLEHWREAWADQVNARLAALDIDARVDHRSLEAQGIGLEPQHKIGPAAARMAAEGRRLERIDEHRAIARSNGVRIIARPHVALDAITHGQATFTTRDLARFIHRHSEGKEQFDRAMAAVRGAPELVRLGRDGRGEERFSTRAMIACEQRLAQATAGLEAGRHHPVPAHALGQALTRAVGRGLQLTAEQRLALDHVTAAQGLGVVIGYAGTGKSAMLGVAREAWERAGYQVEGVALSGIAADNLQSGSGIASRTIASLEHQWAEDRARLSDRHILVIDEAGMIGTRQMERVIAEAGRRGAKVVLVGDPEQLQAIEAGAAFRSIAERHGGVEIAAIRRQHEGWQRDATRWLATGRTDEAIAAYEAHGHVHSAEDRAGARAALIERWSGARTDAPDTSRIMLTHRNDEVEALNRLARACLHWRGELGAETAIPTERGERMFAAGDRIMFLRNERGLGVKNGSLGTIDSITSARIAVMLDDGRAVAFDPKDYAQIDHGYAATVHKAQGMTVDRVHVLATPGLDRHAAYVALSRHREAVELHYGRDDFMDRASLVAALGRERGKDMASDYLPRQLEMDLPPPRATRRIERVLAWHERPELAEAVARHGRIVHAVRFAHSVGDAPTPEQRAEVLASRMRLDGIVAHGAADLEQAFAADRSLILESADGKAQRAIQAMRFEAEMRGDPELRADMFVRRWQVLERQRRALLRDHESSRAGAVGDRMIGMARKLDRDPQLESILRNRRMALGLPAADGQAVGRDLVEMIGRGRGRGLGVSR